MCYSYLKCLSAAGKSFNRKTNTIFTKEQFFNPGPILTDFLPFQHLAAAKELLIIFSKYLLVYCIF